MANDDFMSSDGLILDKDIDDLDEQEDEDTDQINDVGEDEEDDDGFMSLK